MKKILIADDSMLARNKVKRILKTLLPELKIIEANDGLQAIQQIKKEQFDCIFLDNLMPNMNGVEVLSFMKKNEINMPVVMITADIQQTTLKKCQSLGIQHFLSKPFKNEEFSYVLKKVLNLP